MSWLLFMDESGHDHKALPYEVRGGVAIHASKLWAFVQDFQRLELECFGAYLSEYRKEVKGSKLLDKDRIEWAAQASRMEDSERRRHCRSFLTKGLEKKKPTRDEFTAYGQACHEMAVGIVQLLRNRGAKIFAAAIPKRVERGTGGFEDYLRKDHVFLLERFFYFLESEREHGLLVMDEVEKINDRRFVRRLQNYFAKTQTGRQRTQWIVPTPLFVASDMTQAVQAADLCIYSINWGFRLPTHGMDAPVRAEIANEFGGWLGQLQYCGDGYKHGKVFKCWGIVFVPDPNTSRSGA